MLTATKPLVIQLNVEFASHTRGFSSYAIWQFSEQGSVGGIGGKVDLNVFASLQELYDELRVRLFFYRNSHKGDFQCITQLPLLMSRRGAQACTGTRPVCLNGRVTLASPSS
jgi:hypothetical protein